MNSPGSSDKLQYQKVNLVEKKIYLSFSLAAAKAILAARIYFLNSEHLQLPVPPSITYLPAYSPAHKL